MNIDDLTTYSVPVERAPRHYLSTQKENAEETAVKQPTFLDVFKNIYTDAVETDAQKSADMISLMLGDTDDIEQIQINLQKAVIATDLFVTVKNTVYDAYNEIIRMSI